LESAERVGGEGGSQRAEVAEQGYGTGRIVLKAAADTTPRAVGNSKSSKTAVAAAATSAQQPRQQQQRGNALLSSWLLRSGFTVVM